MATSGSGETVDVTDGGIGTIGSSGSSVGTSCSQAPQAETQETFQETQKQTTKTVNGPQEWKDVALTNQTYFDVSCVYKNNPLSVIADREGFVNVDMQNFEKDLVLESAKNYKFRVAAVNSMGMGPWSEVTAYRTLTPGLPGAPSSVKVNKSDTEGVFITWEAPANFTGQEIEYAVFLAVSVNKGSTIKPPSFRRVYLGAENSCTISKSYLTSATIDGTGGKPAIIFRIAAKNDRGFGPATQVRWLQYP